MSSITRDVLAWAVLHDTAGLLPSQLPGSSIYTGAPGSGTIAFWVHSGAGLVKTKVGDRYVLETMREKHYVLGGEQSGHIIFIKNNTTGDGLATGLHLLEVMEHTDKPMSELNDLMTSYPQALVNATVANEKKKSYETHEGIQKRIAEVEGKFKGEGRVVIRPSGTEPVVRVMIEGKDQAVLEQEAESLARYIEEELR